MAQKESSKTQERSRRISGEERALLVKQLVTGYRAGESIRALSVAVNRSYGFVHRVLAEAQVPMRKRGGRRAKLTV